MMPVNTAALDAVIQAAESFLKIQQALGNESPVTYVLGDEEPVSLELCIDLLKRQGKIDDEKTTL